MKSSRTLNLALAAAAMMALASCSQAVSPLGGDAADPLDPRALGVMGDGGVAPGATFDLIAAQTISAGSVYVGVDGEDLVVTYAAANGWTLSEVHLSLGIGIGSIPTNKAGNPVVGSFPYKATGLGGITSYTFRVPLATYGIVAGTALTVAAHASVADASAGASETAWGAGTRIATKGNWGTFFTVTFGEDEVPVQEETTETAFAYGAAYATPFQSFDVSNRWGWTNGPLAAGEYSFAIYAGAGQSDIAKGTLVGTLAVSYDGSSARITYSTKPGYALTETHLYVGAEPLPRDKRGERTVAPGQYPASHGSLDDVSADSFVVNGLSGSVYVVAHAVVKGKF